MQDTNQQTQGEPGDLSHPSREEWMSYLYGELPRADRMRLAAHRQRCPQCAVELAQWQAAMRDLNEWKVPVGSARDSAHAGRVFGPVLKWAVAAAVVLGLGFGFGRLSSKASSDVAGLRASLQAEVEQRMEAVRAELTRDLRSQQAAALNEFAAATASAKADTERLLSELSGSIDETRALDGQTVAAALQQLDNKWAGLHAALRKELETVAVLTEDGFNDTQQKLHQLASFTQPAFNK